MAVLKDEKQTLTYIYDFGDDWEHKILLEQCLDEHEGPLPICIKGKGSRPPEDSGGMHHYQNMLKTLADPEADEDEKEDIQQWLDFMEEEPFSLEETNQVLLEFFEKGRS
ncbi:plasmid pRiA4b ORF-3 family protein [Falsibacillus albus]|uniref:plasmid pRiA4b ORF-3 family protein n=1 Tax=Falsibacillus albus TaxID=2478915 RepID=UPI001313EFB2|nr:plasmid pRiA4b ORF-3 family protein [Falsibacillus albus]